MQSNKWNSWFNFSVFAFFALCILGNIRHIQFVLLLSFLSCWIKCGHAAFSNPFVTIALVYFSTYFAIKRQIFYALSKLNNLNQYLLWHFSARHFAINNFKAKLDDTKQKRTGGREKPLKIAENFLVYIQTIGLNINRNEHRNITVQIFSNYVENRCS